MALPAFEDLAPINDLLAGFPHPWFMTGGWAIDLHVGRVTRPHRDTEIAILRRDQEALQNHLPDWEFKYVIPGKPGLEPWKKGLRLDMPIHEIHTVSPGQPDLEILLNESTGGVWRFRRMMEIARPFSKMGHTSATGLPYLAPEIVLLYKAKEPTDVDEQDFQVTRSLLADEASEWLRISVKACYPEHPWLASL